MLKRFFIFFTSLWLLSFAKEPAFLADEYMDSARESVKLLTLKEKVAQLFLCPIFSNKNASFIRELEYLLQSYAIGGLLFSEGSVKKQLQCITHFQKRAKIPLLIAQDAEWGVAQRLKGALAFPRQMTLGAINDRTLLKRYGQMLAMQCKAAGVELNFAPVVDVNSNPHNPVIHMRSLGSDPRQVAMRASSIIEGMQGVGLISCCKHFPGHGDTNVDSHLGLPVITKAMSSLMQTELIPFQSAIQSGIDGVMSAHLLLPEVDEQKFATISPKFLTDLLQTRLDFKGLVITDALNMQAVEKKIPAYIAAYLAVKAGADLCVFNTTDDVRLKDIMQKDIPKAIDFILEQVHKGEITEQEIDQKVCKILAAKAYVKSYVPNIRKNRKKNESRLITRLFEAAQTSYKQTKPFNLGKRGSTVAIVHIGSLPKAFMHGLTKKYQVKHFPFPKKIDLSFLQTLQRFDTIVVTCLAPSIQQIELQKNQLVDVDLDALQSIAKLKKSVAVLFTSPYLAPMFRPFNSVLLSYEEHLYSQRAASKVLIGHLRPKGSLPITLD